MSPNGNDANVGSITSPFKSLEAARTAIRNLDTGARNAPVSVYLREGAYELDNTFELTQVDGGSILSPVTYEAYNNEKVVITGSKKISASAFMPLTDLDKINQLADKTIAGNIKVCNLASLGLTNYGEIKRRGFGISLDAMPQMELSVDGERQTLARYPNNEFTKYESVVRAGVRTKTEITNGAEFKYVGDRPALWNKPSEIFVSGVLGANYSYDYYPVGSIDTASRTVTLSEGAIVPYYSKHFFYYENIFEEIDSPGEYYIDRENGLLYLYPQKNLESGTDITVSYLEKPLINTGNASYVTFKGLSLEGGRDSAFIASQTEKLQIINCDIRNFGRKGIQISKGTRTLISGCRLYNIGNTAITVGGGDYVNLESGYNIIENNEISKCSNLDRAYTAGITLLYQSVGTKVRHNKIYDTPHTAMILYGPNHLIEYNEISNAVTDFHDMDAIYMNVSEFPWERGVVFNRNYIHDLGQNKFPDEYQMNVAGIRTDNGGHGITVSENIFYNIGRQNSNAVRGVCALGTRNIVKGNIFVDVAETFNASSTYDPTAVYDMTNATNIDLQAKMNSRLPVYGKLFPELYNFFNEHPKSAYKTNIFSDNLIVNIKFDLSSTNGVPNEQGYRGNENLVYSENNYRITSDPGFENYSEKNFNLRSDSEVFSQIPNFRNIPFSRMGLLN